MRNPVAQYHCSTITISSMSIVSVHPRPLPSSPMTRPLPSTKQHVKIFSVFRPLLPNCSQLVTSETGNGINSCFTDTCDTCPTLQHLAQHSVPQCPRRVCLKQKLWYTCWNTKQNYKLHVSVSYLWHGTPRHHGREMPPYASFLRRRDPTRDQRTTSPCTSACACSASRSPSPGSWSGTSPCWCPPTQWGETHKCGEQWPGPELDHPAIVLHYDNVWVSCLDFIPWLCLHLDKVCLLQKRDDQERQPSSLCSWGWKGWPPPCRAPCLQIQPNLQDFEDILQSSPEISWLQEVWVLSTTQRTW